MRTDPQPIGLPRRLDEHDRGILLLWLQSHPAMWTGWPTWMALDDREELGKRGSRLLTARCPMPVTLAVVAEADRLIGLLRLQHRAQYRKAAAELSW